MYFLVQMKCDWSDEFYVQKFWLEEADSLETLLTEITTGLNPFINDKLYFGSNQYLLAEDVANSIRTRTITKEQYDTLATLLGTEFGTGPEIFP